MTGKVPENDDDKTVVLRRHKPELAKPAAVEDQAKQASAAHGQAKQKPEAVQSKAAQPAKSSGKGVAAASKAAPTPAKRAKASGLATIALSLLGLVLVGLGSALTAIYVLTPPITATNEVTDKDLNTDVVAVEDAQSQAEDEALIKAAIAPRIINLSGDPVIIRQLSNKPRQLLKLDHPPQIKAAADAGITSDVYRFKEVLDLPNIGLAVGAAGSQDDIATLQVQEPDQGGDATIGSTVVKINQSPAGALREFAQPVTSKGGLAEFLASLGLSPARAKLAEAAFDRFYGRSTLQKNDKVAVRAFSNGEAAATLDPVQVSVYNSEGWVGSVAVDDIDGFAKSADPWAQQDIFKTELLPTDTRPEDRPRLLDAIYAAALRNRLPTAVTGEAIMLLSRSQDLEQKVQDGDTITLVYSPAARDTKSGLGRVVFVSIGRTTGNLECYAFQAQYGAQFECLTAAGESSLPEGGMVMPVNGVMVAKFGPQQQASGADQMNFGVDWTAPEGSPVSASFDGDVVSAGEEANFGKVLRLSHGDGKTTMYGYLQRIEPGIVAGAKVKAGQTVAYVGTPASSREPRLHFELRKNDVPVDPMGEMQPSAGSGGVVDQFVNRIITVESANRCDARNPLSTAVGLGQFIDGTWMTTIRMHRPDLLVGRTRQQVLDLRLDCNISRVMTQAFTRDNAAVIRQFGHSVTPGNLYLAHFLGVGGAVKALGGDQGRMISDVFGGGHVRANPFEAGKSLGFLVSWAAKRMGGAARAPAQQTADQSAKAGGAVAAPSNDVSFARYDSSPAFTKLKNAVVALLN